MPTRSGLPTGTVTFLFTDIEGSTPRWEQFPRAMQAALARHDAILREAIESNGGYVFKTVGDAFCSAFPTAPQALEAAVSAQRTLHASDWGDIGPIKVRMGLHTGLGEVQGKDYVGQPLNRVARLLSAGSGGQVLLSLATQQLVRDHLPPGVELKDLGEGGLKGLVRAEHVYQLVALDLPSDFPTLKSLDTSYIEPDTSGLGPDVKNPYKGLRAFHQEDAGDFFGREELVQRLLGRVGEAGPLSRFLAVVGPSGSGKSSVVRAGLIPALKGGALPGSDRWLVAEMLPGAHPMEELEALLLSIAVNPPESLLSQLKEDERGLLRAVKRVLPRDESVELVLVIDQFEEAFTLVEDEPTRVYFLESLYQAVIDPRSRLRVVITLRADFYDRPLLYPDPGELLRQRTEVVLPLKIEELKEATLRPAGRVGVQMEPELIVAIVKDVGEQPGTLPLLQYALTELFDRRRGRVLTLQSYQESGGVLGALSRRAELIYGELDDGKRAAARQLFLRLITLGEGVEDTRRRVRRTELATLGGDPEALDQVIETFGSYRLLTFDQDPVTHGSTVEVAHEALIRTWPRLWEWLESSREKLRVQRQLLGASVDWVNSGRDPSFLVSGARLSQFEALAEDGTKGPASDSVALTGDERAYLNASVQERESARVARERLRRRITIGLAIGLVLTLVLAALAVVQSIQASDQRNEALSQASARATAQVEAETRRAEAVSRELAAKSRDQLRINPTLALLLSIEAARVSQTDEAEEALSLALVWIQPHSELRYPGRQQPVYSAVFSPDGKRVATTSSIAVRVWDVNESTGTSNVVAVLETPRLPSARPASQLQRSAAFSPDGKQLLVGSDDGIARVWDIERQIAVVTMTGHTNFINSVGFSPDGKRVATGSSDYTARIWDAGTGKQLVKLVGHTARVTGVAFSPDGKLVVTASGDNTAKIWDSSTGQVVLTLSGHTGPLNSAMFSPDGKRVVTASNDRTARVWDAGTGETLREITGHRDNVNSAAFSPDGERLVTGSGDTQGSAIGSGDKTAKVWDAYTGLRLADIAVSIVTSTSPTEASSEAGISSVTFSPDGKRLLMVTSDPDDRAWIYPWELFTPLQQLLPLASTLPTRPFTCAERQTYLHETAACGTPTP